MVTTTVIVVSVSFNAPVFIVYNSVRTEPSDGPDRMSNSISVAEADSGDKIVARNELVLHV